MAQKLTWGILGTGNIARQFCAAMPSSLRCALAAVGSRQRASAETFAADYSIPHAHDSYQSLINDPSVQAVYISLPNSLHHQWTLAALQAGKHVLCEKPLAMSAGQAVEMFDAAKTSGKLLVEAFMYRSHPLMEAVVAALRQGAIGELRFIRSSFCYRTRRIDGNVRFIKHLGGGGLLDIGCYCINLARYITGAEPTDVQAVARFHPSGVDESLAASMAFPDGVLSSFTCGMSVQADNTAYICGTEGYIEIPIPWKPPQRASFTIAHSIPPRQDESGITASPPPREARHVESPMGLYALEADDFAAAVQGDASPRITPSDSIGNMQVLDRIGQIIGLNF